MLLDKKLLCLYFLLSLMFSCDAFKSQKNKDEIWIIGSNGIGAETRDYALSTLRWYDALSFYDFPGKSDYDIKIVKNPSFWGQDLGGSVFDGLKNVSTEMLSSMDLDKGNLDASKQTYVSDDGSVFKPGNANSWSLVNNTIMPLLADDVNKKTPGKIDKGDIVIISGYSGGGQISLNAADYLNTKYGDDLIDAALLFASPINPKRAFDGDIRVFDLMAYFAQNPYDIQSNLKPYTLMPQIKLVEDKSIIVNPYQLKNTVDPAAIGAIPSYGVKADTTGLSGLDKAVAIRYARFSNAMKFALDAKFAIPAKSSSEVLTEHIDVLDLGLIIKGLGMRVAKNPGSSAADLRNKIVRRMPDPAKEKPYNIKNKVYIAGDSDILVDGIYEALYLKDSKTFIDNDIKNAGFDVKWEPDVDHRDAWTIGHQDSLKYSIDLIEKLIADSKK